MSRVPKPEFCGQKKIDIDTKYIDIAIKQEQYQIKYNNCMVKLKLIYIDTIMSISGVNKRNANERCLNSFNCRHLRIDIDTIWTIST